MSGPHKRWVRSWPRLRLRSQRYPPRTQILSSSLHLCPQMSQCSCLQTDHLLPRIRPTWSCHHNPNRSCHLRQMLQIQIKPLWHLSTYPAPYPLIHPRLSHLRNTGCLHFRRITLPLCIFSLPPRILWCMHSLPLLIYCTVCHNFPAHLQVTHLNPFHCRSFPDNR